jgi:hypothetical protein
MSKLHYKLKINVSYWPIYVKFAKVTTYLKQVIIGTPLLKENLENTRFLDKEEN